MHYLWAINYLLNYLLYPSRLLRPVAWTHLTSSGTLTHFVSRIGSSWTSFYKWDGGKTSRTAIQVVKGTQNDIEDDVIIIIIIMYDERWSWVWLKFKWRSCLLIRVTTFFRSRKTPVLRFLCHVICLTLINKLIVISKNRKKYTHLSLILFMSDKLLTHSLTVSTVSPRHDLITYPCHPPLFFRSRKTPVLRFSCPAFSCLFGSRAPPPWDAVQLND